MPYKTRTNFDRATEGLQLCDLMEGLTGVDSLASQITDALCHLMHTCRLMRDEGGDDIVDLAEEAQFDRAHDVSDYEVLPCSCYDVTVTLRPQA